MIRLALMPLMTIAAVAFANIARVVRSLATLRAGYGVRRGGHDGKTSPAKKG